MDVYSLECAHVNRIQWHIFIVYKLQELYNKLFSFLLFISVGL